MSCRRACWLLLSIALHLIGFVTVAETATIGSRLADCPPIYGDKLDQIVPWTTRS